MCEVQGNKACSWSWSDWETQALPVCDTGGVCRTEQLPVLVACFPCCHVFHLGTWTRTLGSSSPRRFLGFFFPSSAAPISFSFYCFCTFFSFLFSTKCNRCVHDSVNTAEMYETAVLDQITLPLRRYPHSASALLRRSQSPLFPKSLRLKTSQSVLKPTCLSSSIFTCF